MTRQEFHEKLDKIEFEYNIAKNRLYREYAISNNDVKVGDTVEDHIGSILVEKISCDYSNAAGFLQCTYFGVELNKDGKPNKKGNKRTVWQNNLKNS